MTIFSSPCYYSRTLKWAQWSFWVLSALSCCHHLLTPKLSTFILDLRVLSALWPLVLSPNSGVNVNALFGFRVSSSAATTSWLWVWTDNCLCSLLGVENGSGSQETSELPKWAAVHFRVLTVLCHLPILKVSICSVLTVLWPPPSFLQPWNKDLCSFQSSDCPPPAIANSKIEHVHAHFQGSDFFSGCYHQVHHPPWNKYLCSF